MKTPLCALAALALTSLCGLPLTASAGFSEPPLTFYGRVSSRLGLVTQPVTAGEMVWSFRLPNRAPIEVTARLQGLPGGFSYRLEVPVEKLVSGTEPMVGTLIATTAQAAFQQLSVNVNGFPATVTSGAAELGFAEALRGKAARVDLLVTRTFPDTDGDGMPDYWEEEYGLDPNDPNDANGDLNGDGVKNLDEFKAGADPRAGVYTYAAWVGDFQLAGAAAARDADPDGDGVQNAVEFALDCDPTVADRVNALQRARAFPVNTRAGTFLEMRVVKPTRRRSGIDYRVEVSSDQATWRLAGTSAAGSGEFLARDPVAVDRRLAQTRFIRLRILSIEAATLTTHAGIWGASKPTLPSGGVRRPSRRPTGFPYELAIVAQGRSTAADATSITDANAFWTAGEWSGQPHFVRFTSGPATGRSFLITANTTQQITLATKGADLAALIGANARFDVVPAQTIGSLFGTPPAVLRGNADLTKADAVQLWNGAAFDSYVFNGQTWVAEGVAGDKSFTPVLPGEGVIVARRTSRAVRPVFHGLVAPTNVVTLLGPGENFVGSTVPLPRVLGASGLTALPGWSPSDGIRLWTGRAFTRFFHDGTAWRTGRGKTRLDQVRIPVAAAFFIDRGASAAPVEWKQAPAAP